MQTSLLESYMARQAFSNPGGPSTPPPLKQPVQIRSPIKGLGNLGGQSPQLLGQPIAAKVLGYYNPQSGVSAPNQPQQMQIQGLTAGDAFAPRVQMMSPAVRR
jgi:hypothetical protein